LIKIIKNHGLNINKRVFQQIAIYNGFTTLIWLI